MEENGLKPGWQTRGIIRNYKSHVGIEFNQPLTREIENYLIKVAENLEEGFYRVRVGTKVNIYRCEEPEVVYIETLVHSQPIENVTSNS